jgi:hypothetical protein
MKELIKILICGFLLHYVVGGWAFSDNGSLWMIFAVLLLFWHRCQEARYYPLCYAGYHIITYCVLMQST